MIRHFSGNRAECAAIVEQSLKSMIAPCRRSLREAEHRTVSAQCRPETLGHRKGLSSFIQPVAVRLKAFHWLRSVPQMESCNAQHIVRGLGRTNARSMSDRAASGPYRRRNWIKAETKGSTQHQTGLTLCLEIIARNGRYPIRLQNDTRREEVEDVHVNAGLRCGGRRGRQPSTSSAYANDLTDVVSKVR